MGNQYAKSAPLNSEQPRVHVAPGTSALPGAFARSDLSAIFEMLTLELRRLVPPFSPAGDFEFRYELWSLKEVRLGDRLRRRSCFAQLVFAEDAVRLYYPPLLFHPEVRYGLKQELLQRFNGTSCLQLRSLDRSCLRHIVEALSLGHRIYVRDGLV